MLAVILRGKLSSRRSSSEPGLEGRRTYRSIGNKNAAVSDVWEKFPNNLFISTRVHIYLTESLLAWKPGGKSY